MTVERSVVFVPCVSIRLCFANLLTVRDALLTARPVSAASSVTDLGCWSAITFNNRWFSLDNTLAADFTESWQITTG